MHSLDLALANRASRLGVGSTWVCLSFCLLNARKIRSTWAPTDPVLFALGKEFVPLVDGRNTGNRPFLVVKNLSATCGGPRPGHTGNYGSSEVVQPPSADAGEFVKCAL